MRSVVVWLLGVVAAAAVVAATQEGRRGRSQPLAGDINLGSNTVGTPRNTNQGNTNADTTPASPVEFPSKFLGNQAHVTSFLNLMQSHFDASLDFLYGSKYYGDQEQERPGMSKLLSEESNRHWEEGMDVLKMYLHLGGTTFGDSFHDSMNFEGKYNYWGNQRLDAKEKYRGFLTHIMGTSRTLANSISDVHHTANHLTASHGDAEVAHYLQEKTEKESAVARQMIGHFKTLEKMDSLGIAVDIFDKNL